MTSNKENCIYLVWHKDDSSKIKLGKLWSEGKKYYFQYFEEETKKAVLEGFKPLENFPRIEVAYFREEMFTTFKDLKKNSEEDEYEALNGVEVDKNLYLEK
ncbi:hypothetical protein SAMN02745248_02582 [Hathewaya proteolytica DSM 3090]|uniref:Uncharacterized protein n=1 Tax=Hathewaya proteolytica DSM 3090 TaxID=1121331 RepID=A0A1M6SLT7_9CLOT|nr:hypothetical protein [Hathewaya proteolytica]SHK45606.1 hypothetical protein SAMN02745248_02582 [Hathewaya proteolytica DSM 3090]